MGEAWGRCILRKCHEHFGENKQGRHKYGKHTYRNDKLIQDTDMQNEKTRSTDKPWIH